MAAARDLKGPTVLNLASGLPHFRKYRDLRAYKTEL